MLVQTQSPLQKLIRMALALMADPKSDIDDIADSIDPNLDNHPNITEGYLQDIINNYYANKNMQIAKEDTDWIAR